METGSIAVTIGFVIPVIGTHYLAACVRSLARAGVPGDTRFLIINDGNAALRGELEQRYRGYAWLEILHLPENRAFAGANNAGWRALLERYPSLQYLGTLNSDTRCRKGWLDALRRTIGADPGCGMVAPLQEVPIRGWFGLGRYRTYATWSLGDWQEPMRPLAAFIDSDTESEVVSAFCFLARRGLLEQVGMFEPAYRNSCEDIDLCLKIRKAGFRIMVSRRARVLHHGEASRYLPGTSTDLDLSHDILRRRWFADRHLGEKHE